ncbi:DUF2922 domain-containing protein [Ureibacillus manganicus]|uniref:DUF2922 domain-containing protein n=1 Tax=Ureibacillus manganicus DSM 26584 TaxID=1384049 RepID=A0A0A3I2T5_9BACL|nr:DUF2922 domain-containing protein [Ureibacillus manganicus]KGR77775.1 hypothetical protein CD29_14100 [Ureibacillus manganicus DSM 26584]
MALTLEMKFNLENGKTLTLSVSEPKENITPAEVVTAMQTIIDQDVFHSEGYAIIGINQARIVERNVSELELV